jgi:hypothetical protein
VTMSDTRLVGEVDKGNLIGRRQCLRPLACERMRKSNAKPANAN